MRNKDILHTITLMLMILTVTTSCDKQRSGDAPLPVHTEEMMPIYFSLHLLPPGAPVSYAIHDEEEYAVNSLQMLFFKQKDNDFILQRLDDITDKITGQVGPVFNFKMQILAQETGVYKLLFIANEEVNFPINTKLSEIQSTLSQRVQNIDISTSILAENGIPMTGFATQGNSSLIVMKPNASCAVNLERIVCRLDIRNRAKGLVITDVQLKGVPAHSYLLPPDYTTFDVATGGYLDGYVQSNSIMPAPFDQGKDMNKAFYLFENHASEVSKAIQMNVVAKYNDVLVYYKIPFVKDDQPIFFKRNHLYILQLGNTTTEVKPDDWEEVIIVSPFYLIRILKALTDSPVTYNKSKSDSSVQEFYAITLDKGAHRNQRLQMQVPFVEHTKYIVETVPTGVDWVTVSGDAEYVTFDIDENTTGYARGVIIKIQSDIFPYEEGTCYLELVQEG